ncbi:MAG: SDR family oxidoreductase [Spirochaeta sp.]|jgi:NAD(P)-dependent dehydrogenase (short-subunit alcohol dehydrogenase family)|nr:SDR family oxidoreductase [Spirochaeta sp.]
MNITDFNMEFFSLTGKNAIVTGGNTGLGQAFSLALAKAGANVLMPSIMPDDPEFTALIEAEGVKAAYMPADLTQPGLPKQTVERCVQEFGSVDILVNCAGVSRNKEFKEYSRTEWDLMVQVNLTATFEISHEAALHMIEQRSGKIINIGSLYSFLGGQWSPAYAATKHAIAGLTKALCDELAQYDIQVNGIAPGYFATNVTEKTRSDPERNKWVIDHSPVGRWGDVADLMGTTVFLASKASQFVNGHILVVDGGFLTR